MVNICEVSHMSVFSIFSNYIVMIDNADGMLGYVNVSP
jgi:hypothetical protein